MQNKFKKAFTLIELLIVIAIIAILTVAFLPGALKAPARARDAGKIKKVQDIVAAVEAYSAQKSKYPVNDTTNCLVDSIASDMNIELPKDSVNLNSCGDTGNTNKDKFFYAIPTAGNFYVVGAKVETKNSANAYISSTVLVSNIAGGKKPMFAPPGSGEDDTVNFYYLVVGP